MAFTDWLACAYAGRLEPAAMAARSAGDDLADRVVWAATAGHVLDFDDTYLPGLAHLSAPTAPVAILVAARRGVDVATMMRAYADGFEAMAAVSRASHPALYRRGWHPTAVCGVIGAAVTAASLLELGSDATTRACNLAVLGAGGLRAAFGSDGKSVQVGMAALMGLQAAKLAQGGARVPDAARHGEWGFEAVLGARWSDPDQAVPAVRDNWIKRYPCCLQTHGAIEVAVEVAKRGGSASGRGTVTVHPISRQAAPFDDDVRTGLEAKFSIPYCTALGILRGHPTLEHFNAVDPSARALASRVAVREDDSLLESEARLHWEESGQRVIETETKAAVGSPQHPMTDAQVHHKLRSLGADHVTGLLEDPGAEAIRVAEAMR